MWHVHPHLRGVESVQESSGIFQSMDSKGVDLKQAEELAGTKPTIVAKQTIWYHTTKTVDPS